MTAAAPARILMVEDSADDAVLAERELRRAGLSFEVEVARTREDLRRALERARWDLVLCDYTLPGFGGTEALEIVRFYDPDIPFIFVSGTMGEEKAVEAMRAGARDYVLKGNLKRLSVAVERELAEATARRVAESRARSAAATTRAIVDASPVPIIGLDRQGLVRLWNPAAEIVFGWTAEEVLGGPNPTIPPDERGGVAGERARALEEGASVVGIRARRVRKDGSSVSVRVSLGPIIGPDGKPDGVVGLLEDVTESEALEAQLVQAQKLEAVGRLAGGVAHDFNNLLTVILTVSQLLVDDLSGDEGARESVREIREAAEAASMLTQQLLAFSRKELVEPRAVDLNRVVEGVMRMIGRLIHESVRLTVEATPGLPATRCDPGQLEQVVLNLAVNAQDAMPAGGELILRTSTARVERPSADELGVAPGEFVVLTVRDTGTGIAPEHIDKIFDPFFTTKMPGVGTGLGLATCHKIARDAGGSIHVRSEPGRGTTFDVYLPRVDETVPGPAMDAMDVPRGTETILLVEDDARVAAVMDRVLTALGYEVLQADTGAGALETLREHGDRIDLLLTDVVLPGLSGREIADRARAMRPGLRVLFASGYTEDDLLRQDVLTQDVAFVGKPFTPDSLGRKVREALDAG